MIFAISSIDLEVDTHPVRDYPELSQSAGLSLIRVNWSNYPDYPIGLSYRIIPDYPRLSPNWPKLPQIDPNWPKILFFSEIFRFFRFFLNFSRIFSFLETFGDILEGFEDILEIFWEF